MKHFVIKFFFAINIVLNVLNYVIPFKNSDIGPSLAGATFNAISYINMYFYMFSI